ncbi:phosphoribosylaminoimidazolesuccinocarboxamide synthase [Leptospira bandrabouensis]|uniref:Phosphoribosylaminoimidazole-succinocarboxamide synthase n=1 Tax=Leptospira bandrabouensis TaxID=2484903 RepID=A0A6H3NSP3_9LEPT|nr:phosphoribosylaminoimidazolesuccinocarboxamide synthase [Leptospira bandrabouensis]MCG6144830.1 phosphoribosylaminoimidazolesuccinocarboxamide synthase [Leptospira bandrabouensis]MCG6160533.1 phosphoribosylaminoimidazolesuccinocarboxamide synthase [Leptospira bandrabouensis]MCG6164465.1 phosphoribosylaminoimidazolesuccinocarboxamide synthase [Leptospira bandrabouensis]TGN03652.1 phosphoribosylaminoimidazolesuccinocarboxamide synthase [Leptospira bandrabouensis]TGN12323.1 phosphoribosylamino
MIPTPSYKGKVRDVYDLGDSLLLVATDRISAFDVVFEEPVLDKGKILTRISTAWFRQFPTIPNHLITDDVSKFPPPFQNEEFLKGRSVLVKKAKRIDFECVVRGYLTGSAWKEYKTEGTIAHVPYPKGLEESYQFETPIFTPARKNDSGHDENVSESVMEREVGKELFSQLKEISLFLYNRAHNLMAKQGILLCDTKFEFGLVDGKPILIDEILTPDSSRYWDASTYALGKTPASFDKQILRNWLESTDWDKNPPAPALPESLILELRKKYLELEDKITLCLSQK